MFKCYSCNFHGDIIELIKTRWDLMDIQYRFIDVINFICDTVGITSGTYEKQQSNGIYDWQHDLRKYIKRSIDYDDLVVYDDSILNFFEKKYHQSWIDESISLKTMKKYGIRWYERANQIIIPVYDESKNLVGIRARNMNPEANAKYIPCSLLDGTTYKFPSSQVLYGEWMNFDAIKKQKICYIVEGEKSVLKLSERLGIDNNPSLAMFGSNLSKYNRDKIVSLGINELVIIADRDFEQYDTNEYFAWEKKMFGLADKFKGFCKVSIAYDKELALTYKDNITDGSKEYFEKMLNEREIFL